ncbi:MAG: hypothetical protein GF421_12705 [Candidatus Aminicenantes bacterium]|nr:hypothetical protein [Candidatus Aminicenantes bacterium]
MKSKERFLKALERKIPDRLPVTTHHVMPSFLDKYMEGISSQQFFDYFGLDPILWLVAHRPSQEQESIHGSEKQDSDSMAPSLIESDNWTYIIKKIPDSRYHTLRYEIQTPDKTLAMTLQSSPQTSWVSERLIKEKKDIELFEKHAPVPLCDVETINEKARKLGDRGLVRGMIPGFDVYGQPGCWQDAAVLFGIEELIMETFQDPEWVHAFLNILKQRKKKFIQSMKGAEFDLIEHGGGDASSTVISPKIFDEFVAPYDAELIAEAHKLGQRVVYHTCGGMMPLLERIADMGPDAAETFTPKAMGGDADLKQAKKRIGHRLCMIGGFDQFHYFKGCTPEETRKEVRRCFEEAGQGGGFILAPSDHFFDAEIELIQAYADEARKCTY